MSNLIDDTENILILVLLLGVLGAIVWLILQFKGGSPDLKTAIQKAQDGILGGAGTPGSPDYVSGQDNVSRWYDTLFGSGGPYDVPADSGSLVENYQFPTPGQMESGMAQVPSELGSFLNTAQNNPGALPVF